MPPRSSAPTGSCPTTPEDKAATLAAHGLGAVGQFVPVVLHDPAPTRCPTVEVAMTALVAAQALDGRARRRHRRRRLRRPARRSTTRSGPPCWTTSTGSVTRPRPAASPRRSTPMSARWSRAATRPTGCSPAAASACAWTPGTCSSAAATRCAVAASTPSGSRHVHLKDVRLDLAREVQAGEDTYTGAVAGGHVRAARRGGRRHRGDRRRPSRARVRRLVRARAGHHPHRRTRGRRAWTRGRRPSRPSRTSSVSRAPWSSRVGACDA